MSDFCLDPADNLRHPEGGAGNNVNAFDLRHMADDLDRLPDDALRHALELLGASCPNLKTWWTTHVVANAEVAR